ncbi:MAG: sensor histidine kinase [Steroidobacteraceae bacterium]
MQTSSRVTLQQSADLPTLQELHSSLLAERTERTRLQSELELCNCALDAASTHFMIIDVSQPQWRIIYVNRAICERHGYTAAELLGQSPALLVCSERRAAAMERIAAAVRQGTNVSVEVQGLRKDHSTFWVGISMTPIRTVARGVSHYLCIGADITGRLAQERAQRELQERLYNEMQERERMAIELRLAQKLESVGRLAAGIAHEINTPIQYVGDSVLFLQSAETDLAKLRTGYRRAVKRLVDHEPAQAVLPELQGLESSLDLEFLAQEIPKAFERTLDGIERVAAIVRAMKEFAHPDSAQHDYADLNRAFATTLTVARTEYKYHAEVETRFGELPPVNCNVGELNQVFLNLIVNAAHALAESGKDAATGRITIVTAAAGDQVTIAVTDNGCGIPRANLDKVFDPFFTTKPVGRGTGQGLAIARSIVVEKHGGRIDVQSVVGAGTTFTLHLPVAGHCAAVAQ